MSRIIYSLIVFIIGLIISCGDSHRDILDGKYLIPHLGTDSVSIVKDKNDIHIKIKYPKDIALSTEYLASSVAMMYYDSTGTNLQDNKIERLQVEIQFPEFADHFVYNISFMNEYKKGLEQCQNFVEKMLEGNAESLSDKVDPSKITKENLTQVNAVGRQIQEEFKPVQSSMDGFVLIPNESNKMQTKMRMTNAMNEEMTLAFQYDITTGKIFYFGVND